MDSSLASIVTAGLTCDVCGRLPRPHRLRLTLVKLAAVFPVEFVLHALVVYRHLSYLLTVAVLTVTTTVLVIWVVEPSAMRVLRAWLHAPTRRARRRVDAAPALWRVRTTLDEPGSLEHLTRRLAQLGASVLSLHVHPLEQGTRNDLVVAAPERIRGPHISEAVADGGGNDPQIWPTSALALVDGQTSALDLAARVAGNPAELPFAVAELLRARVVTERIAVPDARSERVPNDPTTLRVPSPWCGLFVFSRLREPFTPAEVARAYRLAEIAEVAAVATTSPAQPVRLDGVRG